MAKTLEALHAQDVVYADLRPSKVIVSGEGDDLRVSLLLPGNYRLLSSPQGDVNHTVVPVGGAPAYMAPERIRGAAADKRTDVYLFGLLACEAVTGRLPFKGRSPADFYAGHLRAVTAGTAGVDAGAPVLGGGWSLPKGRTGLPLRRTDGTTVLVPTRAPAQLTEAILTSHPARDADTGSPGRVDP